MALASLHDCYYAKPQVWGSLRDEPSGQTETLNTNTVLAFSLGLEFTMMRDAERTTQEILFQVGPLLERVEQG